jgi:glycosyltransferase involved in cell wall biosynthesis
MSDSPTAFTGFGTVTREILGRLAARPGIEVAALGWGHDGWPYDRTVFPYEIYPSRGQPFGRDTAERAIAEYRPDLLVSFGDLWMIDWTRELPRDACRHLVYFPIDGEPFPRAWREVVRSADVAVAYSRYGQRVASEANPGTEIEMIYHGVDRRVFRPLPDREEVRRRHRLDGKFVVGCVARNQPRKMLPTLLAGFARFARDRHDAMLYLHTDPDDIGWDVLDLLRRHGIAERTAISRHARVDRGVPPAKLNEIYNLFDVFALPTAAEGFGLPIVEAMAAGVPVAVTDHSACTELVSGRGELLAVDRLLTIGRYNLEQAIVDEREVADALARLYAEPELRARHRRAGLEFVERLDWDRIVGEWEELLQHRVRPVVSAASAAQ